ncbi:hypothetical protein K431DRAFT_209740, partial [Polychaeton citri CBS 116435]
VILAFLISAYSVAILVITGYFIGFLPTHIVQRMDSSFFFAQVHPDRTETHNSFRRVITAFSDQQLITGIGILIAGYISLFNSSALDQYHWQIVIYLAWMSSNVHLATLTVLR